MQNRKSGPPELLVTRFLSLLLLLKHERSPLASKSVQSGLAYIAEKPPFMDAH